MCNRIDELRKERQQALLRIIYLKSINKVDGIAEAEERIRAIDAEVVPIHAAAKQQLLTGVATDVMQGAMVIQNAATDADALNASLANENERHHEAVSNIVARQNELGGKITGACNALEVAAANLIDSDDELAAPVASGAAITEGDKAQTKPPASGAAGSSTDTPCLKMLRPSKTRGFR